MNVNVPPSSNAAQPMEWPEGALTRIPFWIYQSPEIYALEQRRLFEGPVWNYLCLEAEVIRSTATFNGVANATGLMAGEPGRITCTFAGLTEGAWHVRVRARDWNDNVSAWVTVGTPAADFNVDQTAPDVPVPASPVGVDVDVTAWSLDGGVVTFAWAAAPTHRNPRGAQVLADRHPMDTGGLPMRCSVQPNRPSASTSSCLCCFKTLLIPARDSISLAFVNVSAWSANCRF